MSIFLDTSVLVAAFWGDHPQHDVSVALLKTATLNSALCAAHTVAEVYSTMTRLPVKPSIPPEQALLFVQQIRQHFTTERLAQNGLAKNYTYDGLIVLAAQKSGPDIVYTWNISGFLQVSPPSILSRIRVP